MLKRVVGKRLEDERTRVYDEEEEEEEAEEDCGGGGGVEGGHWCGRERRQSHRSIFGRTFRLVLLGLKSCSNTIMLQYIHVSKYLLLVIFKTISDTGL